MAKLASSLVTFFQKSGPFTYTSSAQTKKNQEYRVIRTHYLLLPRSDELQGDGTEQRRILQQTY